MNTKIGNLSLKQLGIALLAAVAIALWQILGPALQSAVQTGTFIVNWSIVFYSAIYSFASTLVALLLTDQSGRPLWLGKK